MAISDMEGGLRTRDLKPDFWTDDRVVSVSDGAKLLFQGLWGLADREGRLEDKPVTIGLKVRPWDPQSVPGFLAELHTSGLIVRYQVGEWRCIGIPKFPEHQQIHPKEMASKLPDWKGNPESPEKVNLLTASPGKVENSPLSSVPSFPSSTSEPSGSSLLSPPEKNRRTTKLDTRHGPLRAALIETFRRKRGIEYPFDYGREDAEVRRLLKLGTDPTVLAAWERALDSKYPTTSTLVEFRMKFAHFVGATNGVAPPSLVGSGPLTATEGFL